MGRSDKGRCASEGAPMEQPLSPILHDLVLFICGRLCVLWSWIRLYIVWYCQKSFVVVKGCWVVITSLLIKSQYDKSNVAATSWISWHGQLARALTFSFSGIAGNVLECQTRLLQTVALESSHGRQTLIPCACSSPPPPTPIFTREREREREREKERELKIV